MAHSMAWETLTCIGHGRYRHVEAGANPWDEARVNTVTVPQSAGGNIPQGVPTLCIEPASAGEISQTVFHALLLANPADAYRLFNLAGFDEVALLSGTVGMMGEVKFPPSLLIAIQLGWVVVPLGIALALFQRKEI